MNSNTENISNISEWKAFTECRCPRCRVGYVYTGSVMNFQKQKMIESCEHCNLKYEKEPGYFYAAMYVSYGLNVAEVITVTVAAYILGLSLNYENLYYYMAIAVGTLLLFAPFNLRYSRLILLYWLTPGIRFEPSRVAKDKENK